MQQRAILIMYSKFGKVTVKVIRRTDCEAYLLRIVYNIIIIFIDIIYNVG